MKNYILLSVVLFFAFLSAPLYSQTTFKDKSEIEFSVGYPIPQYTHNFTTNFAKALDGLFMFTFTGEQVIPTQPTDYYMSLPVFKLEYGYNLSDWCYLGAAVSYNYYERDLFSTNPGGFAWRESSHNAYLVFNFRGYWLNRANLRLYSSARVGIGFYYGNSIANNYEESSKKELHVGLVPDITLIGLQVGKKLYGRFEVGTLISGLVTAGIGYRF